jgi:hypothetical protein
VYDIIASKHASKHASAAAAAAMVNQIERIEHPRQTNNIIFKSRIRLGGA